MTPHQKTFLAALTAACDSVRPTVRNTTAKVDSLFFNTALKNAKENWAGVYLKPLGFTDVMEQGTGGSKKGDFSSDTYATTWTHQNGAKVVIVASFLSTPAQFQIGVKATEEQLAAILAPKEAA